MQGFNDNFSRYAPDHVKRGYGALEVGQMTQIPVNDTMEAARVRGRIGAYGQYYGKKFRTRCRSGFLIVRRVK